MKRFLSAIAVLCCTAAMADFSLDNVFSSNMVLQRGVPISFYGKGTAGTLVTVAFKGKSVGAKVGDDGTWKAEFPAAEADHVNYAATFSDGTKTIELKDILIGDVWFCSGQSNMEMPIGATFRRGWSAQNCEEEVRNSNHPELRYARQKRGTLHGRYGEANLDNGGWVKSGPEYAASFSATAYFFGRKLLQDVKVPIGLIVSPWSGTSIQPWISKEGYANAGVEPENSNVRKYDLPEEELNKYDQAENSRYMKGAKEWYDALYAARPELSFDADALNVQEMNTADWQDNVPYNHGMFYVRWYRQAFKLNPNMKESAFVFIQNPTVQCDVWLNGRHVSKSRPGQGNWLKRSMYIAIPKDSDKDGEYVLTVRAEFVDRQFAATEKDLLAQTVLRNQKNEKQALKQWKIKEEAAIALKNAKLPAFPAFPDVSYKSAYFPTHIYTGQVATWTKVPIKGVIWYQGCSNNGNPHYYPLHKALIEDWRAKWKQPDMPFIITQLAGYGRGLCKPWNEYDPTAVQPYALTRDVQYQLLALPNVGLACTVDIGECANIHPANKQDVGKRLALEAERVAYKMDIVSQGPIFVKAVPEGNALRLFYKNAEGLKTSDGKAPAGFAIAGENGKFVWAEAVIDGDNIVVSSPEVPAPKYVRYAYLNFHGGLNLQNASDLPAYPFRSDFVDYSKAK